MKREAVCTLDPALGDQMTPALGFQDFSRMRSRREFPRSVRLAVIRRATRNGIVCCEKCPAFARRYQIDHIIADELGGEPVLENAQLLCEFCFTPKNAADIAMIAKAKRREADFLSANPPPRRPLLSRGFPPAMSIGAAGLQTPPLPRRQLYAGRSGAWLPTTPGSSI